MVMISNDERLFWNPAKLWELKPSSSEKQISTLYFKILSSRSFHHTSHVHILQVKITEYLSLIICIWIAYIVICLVLQRMPLQQYNSGWIFCNCSQTNQTNLKQFFLSLNHLGKISVYKHCICYFNVPTTWTKDPLFQQSMNLWLAHEWQ